MSSVATVLVCLGIVVTASNGFMTGGGRKWNIAYNLRRIIHNCVKSLGFTVLQYSVKTRIKEEASELRTLWLKYDQQSTCTICLIKNKFSLTNEKKVLYTEILGAS